MNEINLPSIYEELHWKDRIKVREQYITLQKGLCSYCGKPLTEKSYFEILGQMVTPSLYPPNFFKYPVHLHHDHNTGLTIGAVHNYCNAILWEYHGE